MKALTGMVVECALYQVHNGAHVVQKFEAMGMMINYDGDTNREEGKIFKDKCILHLRDIYVDLNMRYPDVPLMILSRGTWWIFIFYHSSFFGVSPPSPPQLLSPSPELA